MPELRIYRHILLILFTLLITLAACNTRKNAQNPTTTTLPTEITDTSENVILPPDSTQNVIQDSAFMDSSLVITDSTLQDSTKKPKKFLEAKVDYTCMDSIVFDVKNKMMYLYDSSQLNYQSLQLEAYHISIDLNTKILSANGTYDSLFERYNQNPVFADKGQSFSALNMKYDFDTKKGIIREAFTSEGETYLHAKIAKKDSNDVLYVKDAKFTTCSDPEPHFHIAATKAKIIPNDIIVTGPANLQIQNIPTPLVLPFGFFPTKEQRTSGILFPEYGQLDSYGFFLRNFGYYFALSSKYDLALYADIYSSLSFGARANFNYKIRYKYSGSVQVGFNQMQTGDPQIPSDYRRDQDFRFSWQHIQDVKANPNSGFQASVNVQTGNYGKFNSTNINTIVQNIFQSNIQYSRRFANTPLSLSIGVTHDQNTQTRALNITLPNFVFNVNGWFPFKRKVQVGAPKWYESVQLNYTLNAKTDLRTLDTLLTRYPESVIQQLNPGFLQSATLRANFKIANYINITPSLNYREIWNIRNLNIYYDNIQLANVYDTVFGFFTGRDLNASVTMSTSSIYGYYYLKSKKVIGFQHVMTPSVNFTYRPDIGDRETGFFGPNGELMSYSRNQIGVFGAPASGESGALNFALNNTLEMKVKSKKDTINGTKKIRIFDLLNFSTGYDFALDSLNLKPFQIIGNTTLFNNILQFQFGLNFDPYAIGYVNNQAVRINEFEFSKTKNLMRFTNATFKLNLNFQGESKRKASDEEKLDEVGQLLLRSQAYNFVDFNIPYSFSIGYNIEYNKPLDKASIVHTVNLAGDFNITSKWKIRLNLNYDIVNNKITTSSIDIYRDLHCWEMRFNIIPFGITQQYSFTINVKSQLLQALKLNRRNGFVNF